MLDTSPSALSHVRRKQDHLRIAVQEAVSATGISSGLGPQLLTHCALPELDLAEIDTGTRMLDRQLCVPFLISGMTGGFAEGAEVNRRLAVAAQTVGCAMGVGSQRVAIEHPERAVHFRVRDVAPDVLLLANLGAVQLNYGYGIDECRRAVEMIEADALVLHLNPLQEALQTGGNTNWSGLLRRIETVCALLPVPVVVKEVGWGISGEVARRLAEAGVAAIDVGGAGGTSWSEVERHRAGNETMARVCATFNGWGIPTADAVQTVRAAVPAIPVVASGGLRTGIDAASAIALGADLAGFAGAVLQAATESAEAATALLSALATELRICMFCCGARRLHALRRDDFAGAGVGVSAGTVGLP